MSDQSSASTKKNIRTCSQCNTRMSSPDIDAHSLCISCRGKCCSLDDRCAVCASWPETQLVAYVKHRAALERKRRSKAKCRARDTDFATLCTVGTGSSRGDVGTSRDESIEGSDSSAAGSASQAAVIDIVKAQMNIFRADFQSEISAQMDSRLNKFSSAFFD